MSGTTSGALPRPKPRHVCMSIYEDDYMVLGDFRFEPPWDGELKTYNLSDLDSAAVFTAQVRQAATRGKITRHVSFRYEWDPRVRIEFSGAQLNDPDAFTAALRQWVEGGVDEFHAT